MNGGIDDGYVDDELMMVLMEIDASFSQVSFCSSFDSVIVVFVKIYGGGSGGKTPSCHDGNEIVGSG
jgi:hypothetical protein